MSQTCNSIHNLFNNLKRINFPFDNSDIPKNGIYILFEKGELAHNHDRIVRIGTHTGRDQLLSRLKQHFINENKDRSIFRKILDIVF
jgi:aspartate oxidase